MPTEEIVQLEKQIVELKKQLADLRRTQLGELVEDHIFGTTHGPVRLSVLFGENDDLLLVHNMGKGCSYCTLWADGLNGMYAELKTRASLALVSPDPVDVAEAFAKERGWKFPVVVDEDLAFSQAVGRWDENGIWPGVSSFHRYPNGRFERVASADFGPGDDYCAVWPLLDLLKDGAKGWEPNYRL